MTSFRRVDYEIKHCRKRVHMQIDIGTIVDVSLGHIHREVMGDMDFCPIALGCKDALNVGTVRVLNCILVGEEINTPHDDCGVIKLDAGLDN